VLCAYEFIFLKRVAVIHPGNIMIRISTGASTIPEIPSNMKPEPKRYKCPFRSIISPIYITIVTTEAAIEGSRTDTVILFPSRKEAI
jgi:hypothetical protein